MKYSHVNPLEAIKIFKDTETKKAIGVHWGTFKLSTEPLDEPPQKIINLLEKNNISKNQFLILKHGEIADLK